MDEITQDNENHGPFLNVTIEPGNALRRIARFKYDCGLYGEAFSILALIIRSHRTFGLSGRISMSFGMLACRIMQREWASALDISGSLLSILSKAGYNTPTNPNSSLSPESIRQVFIFIFLQLIT